jgi:hypothetical protein
MEKMREIKKFVKFLFLILLLDFLLAFLGNYLHTNCVRLEVFKDLVAGFKSVEVPLREKILFFVILYFVALEEEFLFRVLPCWFLPKMFSFLVSSLGFGFSHMFLYVDGKIYFERSLVHVISYSLIGALFWLSYRSFNKLKLLWNTNLHFATNVIIFLVALFSR